MEKRDQMQVDGGRFRTKGAVDDDKLKKLTHRKQISEKCKERERITHTGGAFPLCAVCVLVCVSSPL